VPRCLVCVADRACAYRVDRSFEVRLHLQRPQLLFCRPGAISRGFNLAAPRLHSICSASIFAGCSAPANPVHTASIKGRSGQASPFAPRIGEISRAVKTLPGAPIALLSLLPSCKPNSYRGDRLLVIGAVRFTTCPRLIECLRCGNEILLHRRVPPMSVEA
jgi:hypothetical protein